MYNQKIDKPWKQVGGSYARAERERRIGNQPGMAPAARKARKPKGPAKTPGVPCRVKNADGQYYDYDPDTKLLSINPSNPDGHLFTARSKASSAVWHTIESERLEQKWIVGGFVLENVS